MEKFRRQEGLMTTGSSSSLRYLKENKSLGRIPYTGSMSSLRFIKGTPGTPTLIIHDEPLGASTTSLNWSGGQAHLIGKSASKASALAGKPSGLISKPSQISKFTTHASTSTPTFHPGKTEIISPTVSLIFPCFISSILSLTHVCGL